MNDSSVPSPMLQKQRPSSGYATSNIDKTLLEIHESSLVKHLTRILTKLGMIITFMLVGGVQAIPLSVYVALTEILDISLIYSSKKRPNFKTLFSVLHVIIAVILVSTSIYVMDWGLTDFYLIYLVFIASATLAYGWVMGILSLSLSITSYGFLLLIVEASPLYYLRILIIGIIALRIILGQRKYEKVDSQISSMIDTEKAKRDFIAIASHNLRTPVGAIFGYLEILKRGDFGNVNAKQGDVVEKIWKNNLTLKQLTEQLLQISIIEIGRDTELLKEPAQFEVLIEDLISHFKSVAQLKRIKLDYHKPLQLLPLVNIDIDRIGASISNIIDNAIKYTEKGSVSVKLEKVEDSIVLSVSDTGSGIPKEDLPKVFNKFFRSGSLLTYNKTGVGLGLYLGKEIVENHGGKISVDSTEGEGTTFTVELPIIKENIL
jgi:signal transduction histidine kinase